MQYHKALQQAADHGVSITRSEWGDPRFSVYREGDQLLISGIDRDPEPYAASATDQLQNDWEIVDRPTQGEGKR